MFPLTLRFCPGDGERKSVRNFVIVTISTRFCTQKTLVAAPYQLCQQWTVIQGTKMEANEQDKIA
jgi:hypothetical protein